MECTRPINIVNKNRTCLNHIFVLFDELKDNRQPLQFKRRGIESGTTSTYDLFSQLYYLSFFLFVGLLSWFCS